jgi:hypothetical protein
MRNSWRLRDKQGVRAYDRLVHQANETHPVHRGGERRTILVAIVTIAILAVAIVKPWGGSVPTSAPSASPTAVALAHVSTSDTLESSGLVETPSPTPTAAPPTAPPAPLTGPGGAEVQAGRLDPGTYTYGDVVGVDPACLTNESYNRCGQTAFNVDRVGFTVPAGWTWNGRYLSKVTFGGGLPDGAAIFFFEGPVQVYADPCHWAGAQSNPPTGPSVDDLMAALAAQPSRSATIAIDRPLTLPGNTEGWAGISVELTVPIYVDFAKCDEGQFRSWGPDDNARTHQGPGQHDLVWAVDLSRGGSVADGTQRLIIDAASFPGTPADVTSEIGAILRSIFFPCHCG